MLLLPALLVLAPAFAGSAPALAPRAPLPPMALHAATLPDRQAMGHELSLKLRDDVRGRLGTDGRLRSEAGVELSAVEAILAAHGLGLAPRFDLPVQTLLGLEHRAEARTGREAADLQGMFRVTGSTDGEALVAAGRELQALDVVEYAFVGVVGASPPGDIGTPTGLWEDDQGYHDADPGIDAWGAWEEGITGATVRVSDVEYGWISTHEDLVDIDLGLEEGEAVPAWVASYGWDHHGTAVVGQIAGVDNGYGVTGGAPDVTMGTYPEYTDTAGARRPEAILSAAADSLPGDVILLEMQTATRPGGNYGPAELDPDVWTATRTAVDAGVVVVGAAGNGAEDLDDSWYVANYLSWGDSGAVIVGAGSADARHDTLYFSTYGNRVDVQGWGTAIVTLGYGDLAYVDRDDNQSYTRAFGGTSGASPIVTVAAALVQDFANTTLGGPLEPEALRALLTETGVPGGSGGDIGPLPDVLAAIDALDGDRDGYPAAEYAEAGWYAEGEEGAWAEADCDDSSALAFPGAAEVWYDGIDGDCMGDDDFDQDGDGYQAAEGGGSGEDCDDTDPGVSPAAEDAWYDGVDSDCSGGSDYDQDGDGADSDAYEIDGVAGTDCDDTDPDVGPAAEELPDNGIDDDCDGEIDEEPPPSGDDGGDTGGADSGGGDGDDGDSDDGDSDDDDEGKGGLCATGPAGGSAGLLVVALLGLVGRRRR